VLSVIPRLTIVIPRLTIVIPRLTRDLLKISGDCGSSPQWQVVSGDAGHKPAM